MTKQAWQREEPAKISELRLNPGSSSKAVLLATYYSTCIEHLCDVFSPGLMSAFQAEPSALTPKPLKDPQFCRLGNSGLESRPMNQLLLGISGHRPLPLALGQQGLRHTNSVPMCAGRMSEPVHEGTES